MEGGLSEEQMCWGWDWRGWDWGRSQGLEVEWRSGVGEGRLCCESVRDGWRV